MKYTNYADNLVNNVEILKYRSDIDGLRSISIIAVIMYHAGMSLFSGGFVGVDIFFVISGYLITGIIVREVDSNVFYITKFYERRIRRIFPALFLVIVFCIIMSYALFMPREYTEFGKSVIASTLFISNLLFWQDSSNYFNLSNDYKPLLHTWSLAIEEQFYIFFPVFLLCVKKLFNARWFVAIIPLFLISMGMYLWGVENKPDATFYLLTARAWQLMLGAILAVGIIRVPSNCRFNEAIAYLGILSIFLSIFLFSNKTNYYALAPSMGAALIILSGTNRITKIYSILSWRPIVFIGLISYSLYLWHWPILVFSKYYLIRPLTSVEAVFLISLSIIISIISWRFVERPFRKGNIFNISSLLIVSVLTMLFFLLLGAYIVSHHGIPSRLPAEIAHIADSRTYLHKYRKCDSRSVARLKKGDVCKIGVQEKPPSFVIWGDSHADSLVPALAEAAMKSQQSGLVLTYRGCAPVLGVSLANKFDNCREIRQESANLIDRETSIRQIFLAGYWTRQLARKQQLDEPYTEIGKYGKKDIFKYSLKLILDRFNDKNITFIADIPIIDVNAPNILSRLKYFGRPINKKDFEINTTEYLKKQQPVFEVFKELSLANNVNILYVHDIFCSNGICSVFKDGNIIYRNRDHLSEYGSSMLVNIFTDYINKCIN